jgi:hypothetical protein
MGRDAAYMSNYHADDQAACTIMLVFVNNKTKLGKG